MRSWISEFFSWGGACEPPARFFPWFNETEDLMDKHAQFRSDEEYNAKQEAEARDYHSDAERAQLEDKQEAEARRLAQAKDLIERGYIPSLPWASRYVLAAFVKAEQDNRDKDEKIAMLEQRLNDLRRDNGE